MARKILLADDSVTAQNMGRKILTDAGYDVITVNNGSAALKRVAEHKPDLVVLDVYMPGYSGLEVCARLKDAPETARIPILLTVGKLEPFKPEEANRVRADAFIVKPFEASELLSVLTRLEDRMVPQAEGVRFSTTVSGIERFSGDPAVRKAEGDDGDGGWKNRLRFPSKKKKEEPEPEPEADFVTTPFRDFRKGGKAPAASGAFPVNAAPAAAQEPGLVPDIPRDITPEELDALSELVAKLDGPIPAAENIAPLGEKIGPEESAAPAEIKTEAEIPTAPAEAKQEAEVVPAAEEAKSEAQALSATGALAGDAASLVSTEALPAAAAVESIADAVETPKVEALAPVEPAPVDRNDEPMFAAAASAAPQVSAEEKKEVQEAPVVASEQSAVTEAAKADAAPPAEESKVEEAPQAEEIPQAAAEASSQAGGEAEALSPSAEELAAALRLLTPAQVPGTSALAEAGAALAEELSRGTGGGSRWVAEAVALSPEEASVSLEAEMFRTFATAPASGESASGDGSSAVGHEEEEAAEAAVEAAEAGAQVRAETSGAVAVEESSAVAMAASAAAPEKVEAEQKDSPAKQQEEAAEEEVAATTFADAIRHDEVESVAASAAAQEEVSSSEDGAGGQEAMGKDAKKGGKSNWHQIHSASAPAAAQSDVVEAAKQTEEPPKAMAAAASADSASDASSIASIVDSVLADLRPRIVEEIAKKLAKK
ncbi:MAG: response regulator [Candidatus Koribacter versatilis]|nr:response regulator [Candidatus Koribacter versatilis]